MEQIPSGSLWGNFPVASAGSVQYWRPDNPGQEDYREGNSLPALQPF